MSYVPGIWRRRLALPACECGANAGQPCDDACPVACAYEHDHDDPDAGLMHPNPYWHPRKGAA